MTEIEIPEGGRPVSEMQERIARAIYEGTPRNCPWSALSLHKKQKHRAEALAAMKAMREPTQPMVDDGVAAAHGCGIGDFLDVDFRLIFIPAIDAEITIAEGGKSNDL